MAQIEISGLNFFMPLFSFLFVFLISYALLKKTQIFGDTPFYLVISLILAAVFFSFSSLELYVRTVMPWFVVLIVISFMVLVMAGATTKNLDWIMNSKLGWFFIILLIAVFLIAAIKVFNPSLHPDLGITSGDGPGILIQLENFFGTSKWIGSVLLILIVVFIGWYVNPKK